jgi:outer membrane protein assembly factor BamB
MSMAGFSEANGQLLWINNATDIGLNGGQGIAFTPDGPLLNDGSSAFTAYDVTTGKLIWSASSGAFPWGMLPAFTFANDGTNFYYGSYDGHVYAVNYQTGAKVWTSDYVGPSDENVYGNQVLNGASIGGGGVLYYSTSTTYHLEPRTRFHAIYAINKTTGKFLWTLPIDINPTSLTNGYLVGRDYEDGIQYCIGQGQTTTTVTTQPAIGSPGSMTIQGTVMDNSPGQPNTPAISDSDMGVWMDYLHGQNATMNHPPQVNGVPVTLTAVDPNGNAVNVGTVTSDNSGTFGTSFTPTTPGLYTIYATFAGSNSYFSSYAETHVTVVPASTTSPTPATTASSSVTNSDLMTIVIVGVIAIIIAIAIATILMLRKK